MVNYINIIMDINIPIQKLSNSTMTTDTIHITICKIQMITTSICNNKVSLLNHMFPVIYIFQHKLVKILTKIILEIKITSYFQTMIR